MCYILDRKSPLREFSWLVPVSGLLHIEMNLARAFTKLNWDVFIGKLSYVLGFKSPKAQEYIRRGADHHKLWHMLEILYISFTLELMVPYVKECKSIDRQPTCNGYWEWCSEVENSNYLYMQHAVLTQLHALMMLRSGKLCTFLCIIISIAVVFIQKSKKLLDKNQ